MNKAYFHLKQLSIVETVPGFLDKGLRGFCASSFQAQSLPSLHMLRKVKGFETVI